MGGASNTASRISGEIAGEAHGVVTRVELLAAGITDRQIERRLSSGALLPEYPGVYRVGHRAPSVEATYMAAVKACRDGAVLSGRAAAYLYRLLRTDAPPPPPEVIAPSQHRIQGIKTRRCRNLDRRDTTVWNRIPVTTVPRTLVDLAADVSPDDLARFCHEAGVRYRITPAQVEAALSRRPNTPGAANLRAVLRGDIHVTLSRLEHRFLACLRRAGLPVPKTNKPAGGRRVDCRWPDHQLSVELDSYTFHNSRHAWEQDRRREREAYARGDQFRRYTHGDVYDRPAPMLRELHGLLRRN